MADNLRPWLRKTVEEYLNRRGFNLSFDIETSRLLQIVQAREPRYILLRPQADTHTSTTSRVPKDTSGQEHMTRRTAFFYA